MSSTRYRQQQPLQIYQDPVSYDHAPMPSMSADIDTSSPLRPIKNGSSRRNQFIFNPPSGGAGEPSPHKTIHQNSSSPLGQPFANKLNMISMPPPGEPIHQTDSMEKRQPVLSKFKTGPQKALFTTITSIQPTGKENYHPSALYHSTPYNEGLSASNYSLDGIYGHKAQAKRVLMEAPPLQDSRQVKKAKVEQDQFPPPPESFPPLHDDGTKPGHSYAMLIGMAILRSPHRRLTLAQIYKWISDTFSYYSASEPGWQNSIRHNLSLNKAFVKQERPKDDPGKGNYWAIEPGMEHQFLKEKQSKKGSILDESTPVAASALAPSGAQESRQQSYKALTPAPQELPPPTPGFIVSDASALQAAELSSDATIPASDNAGPEEEVDDKYLMPASSQPILSSPPTHIMHSSPPVARHVRDRDDTPPPVPRFPTSSRSRSHKRGFASMDDSGYFSSINSSALRPQGDRQLTSEADRPRIKRGRAEEEIARLRGSSYDSPSKGRNMITQANAFPPPSSSPIRRGLVYDSTQMLPPLTPAVKLKAPSKPPPSVSPNTNLRLHRDRVRQLVGSPEPSLICLDETLPWSPAFHIDDGSNLFNDFNAEFDIFVDSGTDFLSVPGTGSPDKRSARRPRFDRAPHTTSVLKEVPIAAANNKSLNTTPMPKFTPKLAPSAFDSPLKMLELESPSKFQSPALSISAFDLPQDEFYGSEFLSEEATEFSGMDILQGFQKIGAGGQHSRQPSKGTNPRPGLGRSSTTRF